MTDTPNTSENIKARFRATLYSLGVDNAAADEQFDGMKAYCEENAQALQAKTGLDGFKILEDGLYFLILEATFAASHRSVAAPSYQRACAFATAGDKWLNRRSR